LRRRDEYILAMNTLDWRVRRVQVEMNQSSAPSAILAQGE